MHIKMLALATAVALTGCGTPYEEASKNQQTTPAAKTSVGIPGPTDPAQLALSEKVFAPLGSQASALPAQIPAAQLITCADNTVSLRTLDVVDALALDVSNGQQTLTEPQKAALAGAVQDLLLSVGGLVLSLSGTTTSCQLDPAMLSGGAPSLPGMDQLPAEVRGPLQQLLATLSSGSGNLDPSALTAQLGQLNTLTSALQQAAANSPLPLVPAVLELVIDTLDDVVALLTTNPDPTAYQGAVTALVSDLAANLQALPTKLAPTGASPLPANPLPIPTPGNPADGLGALTQQLQAVSSIPVLGAPLAGLLSSLTTLSPPSGLPNGLPGGLPGL